MGKYVDAAVTTVKKDVTVAGDIIQKRRVSGRMAKKNKDKKDKVTKIFLDCYYMTENEIGTKEIYEVLTDSEREVTERIEFWDLADVLEIELNEKSSIDIEKIPYFKNETDKEFLEAKGIKSIFAIKTDEQNKKRMTEIFKLVINRLGGFVCSDTDDFMPYLVQR